MIIKVNEEIHLSGFHDGDVSALVKFLNDPLISENTLIPQPYTKEEAVKWIDFTRQQAEDKDIRLNWAIRNKKGKLIGGIGIVELQQAIFQHKCEIGYWLAKPFRSQGIVPETLKVFSKWVFENFECVKLFAPIFSHNTASQKAAEKAGFIKEARLKKHYFRNGKFYDGVIYSLFKMN